MRQGVEIGRLEASCLSLAPAVGAKQMKSILAAPSIILLPGLSEIGFEIVFCIMWKSTTTVGI
jgi:hypothetical protein